MKQYIVENIAPIFIGIAIGLFVAMVIQTVENVITKRMLIKEKESAR